MNKKMTLFALDASFGDLDARGLFVFGASEAAAALGRMPSLANSELSAAAPKPQPASQRNSRRVRRQKFGAVDIDFMGVEAILNRRT
jgi:hypothetical protein